MYCLLMKKNVLIIEISKTEKIDKKGGAWAPMHPLWVRFCCSGQVGVFFSRIRIEDLLGAGKNDKLGSGQMQLALIVWDHFI
jgi:hypothetical protein